MNSNQMYEFQQIESNKGISMNNVGIQHTNHFCFLCIVARITPQYVSKVKHYLLVSYGLVNQHKLHFCVAYFLKTCIEVRYRIEALCFYWFTALIFQDCECSIS